MNYKLKNKNKATTKDYQKTVLTVWLVIAGLSYASIAMLELTNPMVWFGRIMVFSAAVVMPGLIQGKWIKDGKSMLISSLLMSSLIIPFFVAFAVSGPYKTGMIIGAVVLILIELIVWSWCWSVSRLLFNVGIFTTLLLPLLVGRIAMIAGGFGNSSPLTVVGSLQGGNGVGVMLGMHCLVLLLCGIITGKGQRGKGTEAQSESQKQSQRQEQNQEQDGEEI